MPTESGSYDLEDPLHGYSYLSLFPRTCRSMGVVVKPTELSDLESVHNVLKSVALLKETNGHIEQAKMILDSSSEDMQSELIVSAAVQIEIEGIGSVNDEIARKRRPGLGRMQAKFNFNRRTSQPAVLREPKLDITKLEDPEEFFLAHERLENAKKELRKQSGILSEMDVNVNDLSLTARPRRPGIPGRSKAMYKHHCSSVFSGDDILKESSPKKAEKGLSKSLASESLELSLENLKQNHQSPFSGKIQPEATDPVKDGVLDGSISEVNRFLDEILSGTYDHINSEGQLIMLQEQLQIKPINIDNLSLPKLPDIPKYDFKIPGNFSKPRKSIDIQAAFTGMNTKTPVKSTHTPSSVRFSASPTPPKSPFANLSPLKKHIMQLNRSKDSFSDFNTEPYSVAGSSPVSYADKQPDSVDAQEDSRSKFKVLSDDGDVAAVSDMSSHHELLQDSRSFPDPVNDMSAVVARARSIRSNKYGSAVGDGNGARDESQSMTDYYSGSPSNERSDTQVQSEKAIVAPKSSKPDPCMVDQHSSPGGGSRVKQQSTISNLCSEQHEDMQAEDDIEASANKKTNRKTTPVHGTTTVHPQRDDIAADDTDAQEHEPSTPEVPAEYVSMETKSTQPESSIDNIHSLGVELHEKQSELPDIGPALLRVQDVCGMSINRTRKGKSSPVQEQNMSVQVRKKRRRKDGFSRIRDNTAALANESRGADIHDSQSEIPNNHPEQHEELMDGNAPKKSLNKKNQAKEVSRQEQMEHADEVMHPRKKPKRKELSLRKSIAVAGTYFESGVRRSTRIRMRPLEFWRGERFLYGRLESDSTLPTLIGVKKYATPAKKEGEGILKVLDCVDGEKYRELIDLAALH